MWYSVVPDRLRRELDIFLRLGPKAGPIYARLRLLDMVGVRGVNATGVLRGASSFLFVCFGNLMRSPMAEALMRRAVEEARLRGIRVRSAGLHAIAGNEAHPWALAAAREMGISLESHRAQPVTRELVNDADVIFAMDYQNKAELLARFREAARKMVMLAAYADEALSEREISDPYFGDVGTTRGCYGVLEVCIRNLTAELAAVSQTPNPRAARS